MFPSILHSSWSPSLHFGSATVEGKVEKEVKMEAEREVGTEAKWEMNEETKRGAEVKVEREVEREVENETKEETKRVAEIKDDSSNLDGIGLVAKGSIHSRTRRAEQEAKAFGSAGARFVFLQVRVIVMSLRFGGMKKGKSPRFDRHFGAGAIFKTHEFFTLLRDDGFLMKPVSKLFKYLQQDPKSAYDCFLGVNELIKNCPDDITELSPLSEMLLEISVSILGCPRYLETCIASLEATQISYAIRNGL